MDIENSISNIKDMLVNNPAFEAELTKLLISSPNNFQVVGQHLDIPTASGYVTAYQQGRDLTKEKVAYFINMNFIKELAALAADQIQVIYGLKPDPADPTKTCTTLIFIGANMGTPAVPGTPGTPATPGTHVYLNDAVLGNCVLECIWPDLATPTDGFATTQF